MTEIKLKAGVHKNPELLEEKTEELAKIQEELTKYKQLILDADEIKVLIEKVRDINSFMHEN